MNSPPNAATEINNQVLYRRETLTLSDGYETDIYILSPKNHNPTGEAIVYFHGIQSHPGWFVRSASHLVTQGRGATVFMPVRRGSGSNLLNRGDAPCANQLLDDVAAALTFAANNSQASSVHAIGVSWGGKLITAYQVTKLLPKPKSLTLIAPGIAAKIDVTLTTKLAIAASLIFRPSKLFTIPLSDVSLFTKNETMRKYLRNDTLRLTLASARFLYASRNLDKIIAQAKAISAQDSANTFPPTKLILASNDQIIDNAATKKCIQSLTGANVAIHTLPGAHTLEFEQNPRPLLQIITPDYD